MSYEQPSSNPKERALDASEIPHSHARNELAALTDLTLQGCTSTPKLLGKLQRVQGPDRWVPGGYEFFLLMEYLKATDLDKDWESLDNTKLALIRPKFKEAML